MGRVLQVKCNVLTTKKDRVRRRIHDVASKEGDVLMKASVSNRRRPYDSRLMLAANLRRWTRWKFRIGLVWEDVSLVASPRQPAGDTSQLTINGGAVIQASFAIVQQCSSAAAKQRIDRWIPSTRPCLSSSSTGPDYRILRKHRAERCNRGTQLSTNSPRVLLLTYETVQR